MSLFSALSSSVGSVIRKSLRRKCLCEDSILNIKATTLLYIVKELNLSIEPVFKLFDGCDIGDEAFL